MIERMDFPFVIRETMIAQSRDIDDALPSMGEEEFRRFYERTARPLWSYLSRITGDRQQADDLLQEAYYRFYRAGAKHSTEAHRRNSLFQIATNLVRDAARRATRWQHVPLADEDESPGAVPTSDVPSPEHQTAMKSDLSRAMQQLEPLQREMLWLAYAQGASHEEIAGILGLRPVSIRTMLLRARRKLAGLLGGEPAKLSQEGKS